MKTRYPIIAAVGLGFLGTFAQVMDASAAEIKVFDSTAGCNGPARGWTSVRTRNGPPAQSDRNLWTSIYAAY